MKSYLVAYDIFDSKRLYRVARIVEDYKLKGQKSSWETPLDRKSMSTLVSRLGEVLTGKDKANIIAVVGRPILLGKANSIKIQKGGIVII
ncbi:MAG: CRISPR-associated endonuclease Cas2 [Sulfurovaceae bacterium]|nr:CRISPR-associated endonuclease Cas2 [Sulfurovaceae bacterium]